MTSSPFPHHGPLDPGVLRGRQALLVDLGQRIADRRVTALIGPRRYGKTSLLRRVVADLHATGWDTAWVDLYALTSLEDLGARLDTALDDVRGPWRETLDRVAAGLELRLGGVALSLAARGRERPDGAVVVARLLRLLVRASEGRQLVVVFDEFSGIAGVTGAAGLLRTGLQHHFDRIGIVVAGSEPSTMRTLFTDRAEPFYGQADLVEVPPMADEEVVAIIGDGFAATDRRAGPVAGRIAAFAGGHPQRAMQLADAAWRAVPVGGAADDGTWAVALADVRASTALGFERMYASLPAGQQKVLRAYAMGGSIFGSAAKVLDLPAGTATAAREALVDLGHVQDRDGHRIVDPLLADWIRHRFPM